MSCRLQYILWSELLKRIFMTSQLILLHMKPLGICDFFARISVRLDPLAPGRMLIFFIPSRSPISRVRCFSYHFWVFFFISTWPNEWFATCRALRYLHSKNYETRPTTDDILTTFDFDFKKSKSRVASLHAFRLWHFSYLIGACRNLLCLLKGALSPPSRLGKLTTAISGHVVEVKSRLI